MLAFTSVIDCVPLWVIFVPNVVLLLVCIVGFFRSVPYGGENPYGSEK